MKNIIIAIISFVIIGAGIFFGYTYLQKDIKDIETDEFVIKYGDTKVTVTLDEIEKLEMVDFKKTFDNSEGKYIKDIDYKGIPLYKVFEYKNIPYKNYSQADILASDSYNTVIDMKQITNNDKMYLTIYVNGEHFVKGINKKYPGADGGPFVIINSLSEFSNTRVKLVKLIELK